MNNAGNVNSEREGGWGFAITSTSTNYEHEVPAHCRTGALFLCAIHLVIIWEKGIGSKHDLYKIL